MQFEKLVFLLLLIGSYACTNKLSQTQVRPKFLVFSFSNYLEYQAHVRRMDRELRAFDLKFGSTSEKKVFLKKCLSGDMPFSDYVALSNFLGLSVPQEDRNFRLKRLEEEARQSEDSEEKEYLDQMKREVLDTKDNFFERPEPNDHPLRILDFDQNGEGDVICIPRVYFGPTPGYCFYTLSKGSYQYQFDNSGDILRLIFEGGEISIYYRINQIEYSEPLILQCIQYDFEQEETQLQPKLYWASQTFLPEKIYQKGKPFMVEENLALRTHPKVDDRLHAEETEEFSMDTLSRTLRGNVIVDIGAQSEGYELLTKGDWSLVVFGPKARILKTSLEHGMDHGYYERGHYYEGTKIKPYYLGWVESKVLQKKK